MTLAALPVPTLDGDTQTLEQKLSGSRLASGDGNAATNIPNVFTASGTKQYWSLDAVYFARLRSSASTATVQAAMNARCRWLMARVSGHVKYHTKHLPCDHGTSVKPSGRLPSFRDRHDGSSLTGISAARQIIDSAVSRMTTSGPPVRQRYIIKTDSWYRITTFHSFSVNNDDKWFLPARRIA